MPHLCLHSVGSMSDDDLGCVSVLCPASTEKTVNLHPGQNESVNGSTNIHNSISPCGVVDLGLGNIEDEMKKLRLSSDGHKRHQSQQHLQHEDCLPMFRLELHMELHITFSSNLPTAPAACAYLPRQRPQATRVAGVNTLWGIKGGSVSPNYYASSPNISFLIRSPSSLLVSPVFQGSSVGGTSFSGRKNGNIKFPFRNAGSLFGRQGERRRKKADYSNSYSFIEGLKSNKARRYELSDIAGHIVEFSTDQHVLPHASSLMTDVFGNYVIQKFFKHGNPEQRKELAIKLVGNVMPLSLQMYGCRVIQKVSSSG
ncbi:hypothetical protein OPV22_009614 [Ensete ventricosum]|uniref:PUM-HD domain-containing protein n=1 Tax=Ensete ventricosum TaxID=4639 RepID=A0AAV8REW0_ENSVE|nr:hypothetical protein OPV22_009614 [Ensete ventricosum]